MTFQGSKFRVTTKTEDKKLVTNFNKVSSVDKFIKEGKRLRKIFPFPGKVTMTIDVLRKRKIVGSRKLTFQSPKKRR